VYGGFTTIHANGCKLEAETRLPIASVRNSDTDEGHDGSPEFEMGRTRIRLLAAIHHVSPKALTDEALCDWMEVTGAIHLEKAVANRSSSRHH
jgi:hypothetical protein